MLEEAANHFIRGTNDGIRVDPKDGLLLCHRRNQALTWMDGKVADFSNYRKSRQAGRNPGSVAELSFGLRAFAQAEGISSSIFTQMERLRDQAHKSMQRFWNPDTAYLYDVIDGRGKGDKNNDDTLRPNQLLAVAMPFRALEKEQERGNSHCS